MKNGRAAPAIVMRLLSLCEMSLKNRIFRTVSLIRRGINLERNRFSESCHTCLAKQKTEIVLHSPREPGSQHACAGCGLGRSELLDIR